MRLERRLNVSYSYEIALLPQVKEDFTQLLNSVPDIDKHTTWNDVKQRVKEDPLYMMISDVIADQDAKCFEKLFTMEQWFFDYKRDLDVSMIANVYKNMIKDFLLLSIIQNNVYSR